MTRYLFNRQRVAGPSPLAELDPFQRGFYEHLGEEADVLLEPGYDQDEIFDDQFERRAHEKQRTPSANNAVNVIPATNGPWSGNNNLGIERHFAPDINNQQTIIKLPEWGFPEAWSVCLGLDYDEALYDTDGTYFAVTALLTVGVGGTTQQLELDWLQGTVITLPMNALNLVAQYAPGSNEGGTVPLPQDLRLRATLCRGAVRNTRPTRTYIINQLPAGNDVTVPIPPFAKAVHLFLTAGPTPFEYFSNVVLANQPLFLSGVGGGTVALAQRSQFVTYVNVAEQMVGAPVAYPIPEGARTLVLPNVTLGAFTGMQVQFLLGV